MARVTVEDCVDKVPNRFELVMLAAHRAREIAAGSPLTIDRDNDKNPVVALREIAEESQQADDLRERMIESHQTQIEVDEPEEDQMALLMGNGDGDEFIEIVKIVVKRSAIALGGAGHLANRQLEDAVVLDELPKRLDDTGACIGRIGVLTRSRHAPHRTPAPWRS